MLRARNEMKLPEQPQHPGPRYQGTHPFAMRCVPFTLSDSTFLGDHRIPHGDQLIDRFIGWPDFERSIFDARMF